MRRDTAAPQQRENERPAHPPVPIGKGVDALELCVGDGCLHDSWDVFPIEESAQIVKEIRNVFGRGRNELSIRRACGLASDPVLLFANESREMLIPGS